MSQPLPGSGRDRRMDFPFRPGDMPPLFGETASVLVVDDDPSIVVLLERILELEGYQCSHASSADEAMERLSEREISVALVDIMMPGDSGLELVDRALDLYPFLGVVMVTGVDDPQIAELALQTGAFGYLIKPFTPQEVVVAVANAGRRRCVEIENAVYRQRLERHLEEQGMELDDALMQLKLLHDRARQEQAED